MLTERLWFMIGQLQLGPSIDLRAGFLFWVFFLRLIFLS
jgi:hypothetical protein